MRNNARSQPSPLVSVIVPNYNHAPFLCQRLDSILAQDYQNIEVIILDDKSSDGSMEIIRHYACNPKVSAVICNDVNGGSPFKQWQKGISAAKGSIIWIAESDDYCACDFLRRLVNVYVKNDCVLAFTRSMMVDVNGTYIGISQKRFFRQDGHWRGETFIRKYMTLGNRMVNASSAIFSKAAAIKADKQFMQFKESGDWLFWIELARQGNVAVISEPLNFFRRSAQTNTSKATLEGKTDIEDKKVFDYLIANHLMPLFSSFNKRKRMAVRLLYHGDRYSNDAIRRQVEATWNLPKAYYVIARLSHLFTVWRRPFPRHS